MRTENKNIHNNIVSVKTGKAEVYSITNDIARLLKAGFLLGVSVSISVL
jgi:hypothetical protein